MYDKIYNFCKVKNKGGCFKNGESPTPRVEFITKMCDEMGIDSELDVWQNAPRKIYYTILDFPDLIHLLTEDKIEQGEEIYSFFIEEATSLLQQMGFDLNPEDLGPREIRAAGPEYSEIFERYTQDLKTLLGELTEGANNFYNVMLLGDSDIFVVAHHDIVNPNSDNANDNSCSVINAIMIKKLRPSVNVVLLDGEETGGIGAQRLSERIKKGDFKCRWVLNLELTGKGGKNFFVGAMGSQLTDWIAEKFECPVVRVPFNDSVIFLRNGINSTVINPLPIIETETSILTKEGEYLNEKMLFNCHRYTDSVDTIDPKDMEEFVEEICLKIIDEA